MNLVRNINVKLNFAQGVVATIGNFDGVHLGHQSILNKVLSKSKSLNLPSMLVAFEPSAKEYFLGDKAPARLTNFREKFSITKKIGIDWFVCLRFNKKLASMPAEYFIEKILIQDLGVKHLTVGDNFRFGKDRKGSLELLQSYAKQSHFEVDNTESYVVNKKRVSSSSIRKHLKDGNLSEVEKLLGRSYSMSGRVIHGDKKGRTIGFPTANIPIKRAKSPVNGVFAVKVKIEDEPNQTGVANIGHRPTINGTRTQLEVHLFNFSQNIYGKHVTVYFCNKLREEIKFESFDALKNQIEKDAQNAKDYFKDAA